jgi:prepilin-type N-terminal cleavage/methylation domain-containing protein
MGKIFKMQKSGFTMVELLIVMVIIGILAAVAAPIYSANTQRAIASDAVSAMSLIRQAEREYSLRNNGGFVEVDGSTYFINTSPLSVDLKVAQYFSNGAFIVSTTETSFRAAGNTALTIQPSNPVEFRITANGTNGATENQQCSSSATTNCAVNASKASNMCLEMDNTGRIFVNFTANDGATDCSANPTKWELY